MSRAALLAEFLRENRTRGFSWGTWDCAQFCAEWVKRLTGIDHRAAFGAYQDESAASEVLSAHGGLTALVSAVFEEVHPSKARRGDLVLAGEDIALGICIGVQSAHVSKDGLVYRKTLDSVRAWSVQ